MKPPPGQLSLFELDVRGEPLVHQVGREQPPPAESPELPAPRALANHDESRRLGRTTPASDPLALLAGYLTDLAAAPARGAHGDRGRPAAGARRLAAPIADEPA